jgi:hypothetical protein
MDLKIALAQSNFTVGDIEGNSNKIISKEVAQSQMNNPELLEKFKMF